VTVLVPRVSICLANVVNYCGCFMFRFPDRRLEEKLLYQVRFVFIQTKHNVI